MPEEVETVYDENTLRLFTAKNVTSRKCIKYQYQPWHISKLQTSAIAEIVTKKNENHNETEYAKTPNESEASYGAGCKKDMDNINKNRICQNCHSEFKIEPMIFLLRKIKVPSPTLSEWIPTRDLAQ